MDINTVYGIATLVGAIVFVVIQEVNHARQSNQMQQQHESALQVARDALNSVNNNPNMIAAIQGATRNIPPEFFNQVLSVLSTGKLFVPPDVAAVDDSLQQLVKYAEGPSKASPPSGMAAEQ